MTVDQAVLAVNAAIGQLDIALVIAYCEEFELREATIPQAVVENVTNGNAAQPTVHPRQHIYTASLAAYLISDDLASARMLCKRATADIKAYPAFASLHQVFTSLYKNLPAATYTHLDAANYSTDLRPLIEELKKRIRERVFVLITKAYTDVPLSTIANSLGLSLDDTRAVCTQAGWMIDATTGIATRPPAPPTLAAAATGGIVGADGLKRMATISDYVVNLERA
ncbi:hypothetical protein SmJEL517_g05664 [Synchytrium microbalum]|uniref:CSN8/PSMD8/EIF3K domain-containing protein n=1 Tax=Synchytrium microbalum TaxID=1806994 RepID=A0A507BUJ9_9FUNG|nr:uncharacterized protein SmJEL517_g05664 [Synchytrium microbalum]TPX30891.1 hypothetical protein SmJEL517_g05664 [Synchytrium microbalum]